MIVVTGCPRSGTSLMMDTLRIALGDDRIIGNKFPQDEAWKNIMKQGEEESDMHYESRMYSVAKTQPTRDDEDSSLSKDMNPNGFWECRYTVRGAQWHLGIDIPKDSVCKVVSQGLVATNPCYVDKIIYMVRPPRSVAKSQENLRRMPFMKASEERELKVHTPEMFINVTMQAAMWIKEHPDIPILIMQFDELLADPQPSLRKLQEFLGEGDFSDSPIEQRLNRSKPEDINHNLWEIAESIYEKLLKMDWDGIIDDYKNSRDQINKEKINFPCFRVGSRMAYNECLICRSDVHTRANFRKRAEDSNIEWWQEPCMFECLHNVDEELISISDSLEYNFWIE